LRFLQEAGKAYRGRVVFGVATTTLDASGEVLDQRPMPITREDVVATTARFLGEIEQLPPMVSAVKVDGRRLHELARAGKEVDAEQAVAVSHGVPFPAGVLAPSGAGPYAVSGPGDSLLAVYERCGGGLRPAVVLAPA